MAQRRVALVRPRQTFERWAFDESASGNCINIIGWLHEGGVNGARLQRSFNVPNTLIFHQGSIAAWFFSSKQNGALLCKHRSHLNVDNVLHSFRSALKARSGSRSSRKIALLFRGPNEPLRYLSMGELHIYLEHKSISDYQSVASIVQLTDDPAEECDILKVSWINGHCLVEARTISELAVQTSGAHIETRMRPLDSFVNECNPIHSMNYKLAYRDVDETWVGAKLRERLRILMTSFVRHIEGLQPRNIKRLVCMFRLGSQNQLSYLFPLSLETTSLEPSRELIEAVATTDYQLKWAAHRLAVRKPISEQMFESVNAMRQGDADSDSGDEEQRESDRDEASRSGTLPCLVQKQSTGSSSTAQKTGGSHRAKDSAALASETFAKTGKEGTTREPRRAERKNKAKQRHCPRPPSDPRPSRGFQNPVRKLLRAYGSSSSARRLESWLKRKQERSKRLERYRASGVGHRAFLEKLHSKLKSDLKRQMICAMAESAARDILKEACSHVLAKRSSQRHVLQVPNLTAEEQDALENALLGIDSARMKCLALQL
ncbi:Hypothetical Protein FCC1311_081762 [Hondaea fermentalgiana]|uniref:Uncharacterized protein n=1 Tax=Hondaea fermentalgiana TaxID=2315210 RepID=A0A2R5GU87_9STRA|nr:Hypothetical Protein FCC1311_081762 [Hondaea fermentalgiana]|eukprot:GBG31951.1 Hypothetical Protein FCC1311_081762 [Hondaea fermentalgiana]